MLDLPGTRYRLIVDFQFVFALSVPIVLPPGD